MDTVPWTTRTIRIDSRHRRRAQDFSQRGKAAQVQQVEVEEEEEGDASEPLLIREHKRRAVMGRAHRMFHRREAQGTPNVLTVNVEVIATLDAAGNTLGQQTLTPAVSTAPAVSIAAVPSVPSVPPFPSDLTVPTVPAYPWPSGVPTAQAVESSSQTLPSPQPVTSVFPSPSGFNSTSSNVMPSTASSSLNTTSSQSSSLSLTESPTASVHVSSTASSSPYWTASSTAGGGGGGYLDPAYTASPSATPSTASVTDTQSGGGPLETPAVVGTVFGSLAGLALLLALLLFLIRRHKRNKNGGALQLTGDDHTDSNQPMTTTAARNSFIPPSFLNRFSGASRSTAESSDTGERSFQRVSGRKLPSAFSEGMTSEQFAAGARAEGTLSGSSFYHDDKGFYGGPGVVSKDFGKDSGFAKETGEISNTGTMGREERVRPSPARTPVVYHPDDAPVWGTNRNGGGSTLSPPPTPNPDFPPRGSLGRSHPSHDGSRSSRFTENV